MRLLMAHYTTLGKMRRFMAIRTEVRDKVLDRQVFFFNFKHMRIMASAASSFFNSSVRVEERPFFVGMAFYASRDFLFFQGHVRIMAVKAFNVFGHLFTVFALIKCRNLFLVAGRAELAVLRYHEILFRVFYVDFMAGDTAGFIGEMAFVLPFRRLDFMAFDALFRSKRGIYLDRAVNVFFKRLVVFALALDMVGTRAVAGLASVLIFFREQILVKDCLMRGVFYFCAQVFMAHLAVAASYVSSGLLGRAVRRKQEQSCDYRNSHANNQQSFGVFIKEIKFLHSNNSYKSIRIVTKTP